MFRFSFKSQSTTLTAFFMSDTGYSMATLELDNTLRLHEHRELNDAPSSAMANALARDAKQCHLIGKPCSLVLSPKHYQLLQMDASDIPEAELAKALKWRLKGLIEYPLNDIAVDAFMLPPTGLGKQQKKALVAVTPLSTLRKTLTLFQSAYIDITEVGIAELALRKICTLLPHPNHAPHIVISLEEEHCQLHIFYNNQLYLVRTLQFPVDISDETRSHKENILLEIQRSTDYCLTTLKLPEPQRIVLTPGFYKAQYLLDYLEKEQTKPIYLIDLNQLIPLNRPLQQDYQQHLLYSIGGALHTFEAEH